MVKRHILMLWDIDGTLLLTGGAGRVAFNRVFHEMFGVDEIWGGLVPDGRTDDSIVDELFQKRFSTLPNLLQKSLIRQRYCEIMKEEIPVSQRFRVLAGVVDLMQRLQANHEICLGLATGNYQDTAMAKLRHAGLHDYFDFGGFGCDSGVRVELTRAALNRGREKMGHDDFKTYLVGDSLNDVYCAHAIGATAIAVCTGSTKVDQHKRAGAEIILNDLTEFDEKVIFSRSN